MRKREKKAIKQNQATSCIRLHDSAAMSVHDVRAVPRGLLRILFAVLGVCSSFAMLFGFMSVPIHKGVFFASVMVFTVLNALVLLSKNIPVKTLWSFALLVGTVICFHYRTELLFCFREAIDCIEAGIAERPYIRPLLGADYPYTIEQYLTVAFVLFGMGVGFLIGHATVASPRILSAFLLTFGFLEVGLFYGLHTNSLAVFCWVAYIVGMLVISDTFDSFEKQKKGKYAFFYNDHKLYARPGTRFIRAEYTAWLLAIAVLCLGGIAAMITSDETRMKSADRVRVQIRSGWNNLLDTFSDYGNSGNIEPSVDETDNVHSLADRGYPDFNNTPLFSFYMDSDVEADTVYLKTDTYSVYAGTEWQVLPQSTYDIWRNLFTEMNANRSVPQASLREENSQRSAASVRFPSSYPALSDTPVMYRSYYDSEITYIDDYDIYHPSAPTAYRYLFEPEYLFDSDSLFSQVSYPTSTAQEYYASDEASAITRNAWEQYDSFARVNYLQVPYSSAMSEIRSNAAELLNGSYQSTADALYAIRDYIHDKAKYTLRPEAISADTDFASAFLLQTGEGYCVHYATAGVLLCRMMNIPARYATGYVVFGSDFVRVDGNVDGQVSDYVYSYEAQVPDSRAHAWAEVYLPGYGWMPFEFTESYTLSDSPVAQGTDMTTDSTTTTSTHTSINLVSSSSTSTTATTPMNATHGNTPSGIAMTPAMQTLCTVLMILFLIALLIAMYVMLHYIIYSRREQKMTQHDPNLAVAATYALLLRILTAQGITRRPQQSHEEFAHIAEAKCNAIPKGAMQSAVDTQLAATFSRDGITHEAAAEQYAFLCALIQAIYTKASPCKRFAMRWLHHWIK